MTTTERERRYLEYIRESIERIRDYTSGSLSEFASDSMAQDAVIWRLQTLADASHTRLSAGLKVRNRQIDWQSIYGFRNVAAHQYTGVDLDRVWEIVTHHLDPLHEVVIQELARPQAP